VPKIKFGRYYNLVFRLRHRIVVTVTVVGYALSCRPNLADICPRGHPRADTCLRGFRLPLCYGRKHLIRQAMPDTFPSMGRLSPVFSRRSLRNRRGHGRGTVLSCRPNLADICPGGIPGPILATGDFPGPKIEKGGIRDDGLGIS